MLAQVPWLESGALRLGCGWPLTRASPMEALHQLGDVVSEETLAEHDAHISMQPLFSTSGDSTMSREKPSAVAGPSSVSPSRPSSCEGESPETAGPAAGGP